MYCSSEDSDRILLYLSLLFLRSLSLLHVLQSASHRDSPYALHLDHIYDQIAYNADRDHCRIDPRSNIVGQLAVKLLHHHIVDDEHRKVADWNDE